MKLTIEIDLDNPAFEEYGEIERILTELGTRLPDPPSATRGGDLAIHDRNGNFVGTAKIEE